MKTNYNSDYYYWAYTPIITTYMYVPIQLIIIITKALSYVKKRENSMLCTNKN